MFGPEQVLPEESAVLPMSRKRLPHPTRTGETVKYIIASLLLAGCANPLKAKFSVGDCVIPPWTREKWETPWTIYKIEGIGESSYRVNGNGSLSIWMSSSYKKVACPAAQPAQKQGEDRG